jgi:phosphoribosylamine--glycine ligase
MKYLLVGGGGREHAIATALARNDALRFASVMSARNPGIARLTDEILLAKETDVPRIVEFAKTTGADIVAIGPEAPLEAGLVDALSEAGIPAFGPTRSAARIETDKAYARSLMARHGIDGCPDYRVFQEAEEAVEYIRDYAGELAIKPVGLTGGKGVRIMGEHVDREGACAYVRELHGPVVAEERLVGEEFTLQAFVDGSCLVPMPLVQDHKRAYEGDRGPNTGGMGSYSMPDNGLPFVSEDDRKRALAIMREVVRTMAAEGTPYHGVLYGQFMNTASGPMVIEFNARFGDPEAMNVLTLLASDLDDIVWRCTEGRLGSASVGFEEQATVCKYIVPDGYPDAPGPSAPLTLGDTGAARVYFANVEERHGQLWTLRSRSLAFVGVGTTLEEAEAGAEKAAEGVKGPIRYRRDIGTRALLDRRCAHMRTIR